MKTKQIIGLVAGIVIAVALSFTPPPQSMTDSVYSSTYKSSFAAAQTAAGDKAKAAAQKEGLDEGATAAAVAVAQEESGAASEAAATAAAEKAAKDLPPVSMRFIGIFIGFLIWMIVGVAADHVLVLGTLALLLITSTTTATSASTAFTAAFNPFAGDTAWLVVAGFGMAAALTKCGLLKRIAFAVLQLFPENYRGQIMAMFATGLVLSPMLPSVNAKAVLLAPLSASVSQALGFKKSSKGASGLFSASYFSAGLFGTAFFTGSLYVVVMLGFVPAAFKAQFDWVGYFSITWVWLIVMVIGSFLAVLFLYRPDEELKMEKGFAKKQLKELGSMSRAEWAAGIILLLAIILWCTGSIHGINATVIGIAALIAMTLFNVIEGAEYGPKIPWATVILIGGIMSIANMMSTFKVDTWLGDVLGPILTPLVSNVFIFIPVLCVIVFALRYIVISQIATGTIIIAIFGSLLYTSTETLILNPMILAFIVFTCTQVWNLKFHNTAEIAAIAATGGEMVEHKDVVKSSYAYMAINIVAMVVSIPLWLALGMIA
jgi:DASS family divalent anion:Na+ symporter